MYAIPIGKRTGVVSTSRITHATPAAAYAHMPYRSWEYNLEDDEEEKLQQGCRDVAYQLVHGETGKNINVRDHDCISKFK